MEGEHRWDFLARMSEIFVQRILILVKTIQKYIFWFWHPCQKCCKCCNRCLSFWFLCLSRDILVSFFSDTEPFFLKVRENCTVTPKASYSLSRAHTADSLHTRITVFRGFQREYWSRKELKYFLSLPAGKIKSVNVFEQTEDVDSKIDTSTTAPPFFILE